MPRNLKVSERLHTPLTNELTAINQHLLHGRTLRPWRVALECPTEPFGLR